MRIVVFGAAGMLGTKTVSRFKAAGHDVLALDLAELNLLEEGALERFYDDEKFNGAVNCAAYTAVDACEDPYQYPLAFKLNGPVVGEMARLSQAKGRWLIHISTDYVFNGAETRPHRVDDPTDPVNAYGRTKLEGERLFHEAGDPGWIVRTSWLYGPNGKNFVKTIAGLLKTKPSIEVVDDQVGGPTYTGSLASFLLDLAETQPPRGVYHFANDGYISWHGFAAAIREELGSSCEVVPVSSDRFPRPAKRPANSRFDLSKTRSVARNPIPPWREALRDYLNEDSLTRGNA